MSLDAILLEKPCYIDINPRITESMIALRSGVDLVQALMDVTPEKESRGGDAKHGNEGIAIHQLVLTLLQRAERGSFQVAIEFFKAIIKFDSYSWSTEELTPFERNWLSLVVILLLLVLLLIGISRMAKKVDRETVQGYASK